MPAYIARDKTGRYLTTIYAETDRDAIADAPPSTSWFDIPGRLSLILNNDWRTPEVPANA